MSSTRNTHQHDHRSDDETCRRSVVRAVRVVSPNLWVLAIRDVDTELPSRAVAAALVLRSYMNQTATCWPAVATISGGMRASDRTVQRALSQLEASGWLLRTSQGHHKGSKYQAALPQDAQLLARLRRHIATRKDAATLIGHLPISDTEVTPVTPLHDPDLTPMSPLNPLEVTSATSEVTRVSHKDPMKIYNPPPSPPAATGSTETGGRNTSEAATDSSTTDQSLDDHRRPEHISDRQWAAWRADPLRPTNTTTYQWACYRRAIEAIAPEIGGQAHALVLGQHWQKFKKQRELVTLMRQCADIDPDATRDVVIARRYGQLPYAGADNIPAAMLARLRTLADDLSQRPPAPAWGPRAPLAPDVEADLFQFFGANDEDCNPF